MNGTATRGFHAAVLLVSAGVFGGCAPPLRSTLDRPPSAAEVAELWVEPTDATKRDLFYGIGGMKLAPDPSAHFEYVADKKDPYSYSPGCTVRDPDGIKWTVKFGAEARPEVLASRLIWA